jgi:hypothetical protein
MDTNTHSLTLFLYPLCQAISQAANRQTIKFMITTALGIAKQWKWSKVQANQL